MRRKKKVIYLRSSFNNTASDFYSRALRSLDIDYHEILFNPHEKQLERKFDDADLLLLVDCGLPVVFPGLEDYQSPTGYVSIDSCHKLEIHQKYINKYNFSYVWAAQKHVVDDLGINARWLPLAADELIHIFNPSMMERQTYFHRMISKSFYDVTMCGAPHKHRKNFKYLFNKTGFRTNFQFRKMFGEDVTVELAKSIIGFNVSAGFTGYKGLDINMRAFETMANGVCMLLNDYYPNAGLGYEELFDIGKHLEVYQSEQEAVDKINFYKKNPEKAIKIAICGQQHVLRNHTYRHRCLEIINQLD